MGFDFNRSGFWRFALEKFDLKGFRSVAPYIHEHRRRTFVVCLESPVLESPGAEVLLQDIAQLHALGVRIVLVFGARHRIDQMLPDSEFHQGCRVTRTEDLPGVRQAVGVLQSEVQARLSRGLIHTAMAGMRLRVLGGNLVVARPRGVCEGVDFGHTGEVRRVEAEVIRELLQQEAIVLIPPLGYSATGETFNLGSVELACTVAQSIAADKLIYLHTESALRARRRRLQQITSSRARDLLQRRKLSSSWQRMLKSGVDANLSSVARVHFLDARIDGVLLQELFTHAGVGMMMTHTEAHPPRAAQISDVGGILTLIEPLIEQGVLIPRTREELEHRINHFRVIELDGLIVACACLHRLDATHAELVCLAVHPEYRSHGYGQTLLAALEHGAREAGHQQVYVLTTTAVHWFREQGFGLCTPKALPVARRNFYNSHRNSKVLVKSVS